MKTKDVKNAIEKFEPAIKTKERHMNRKPPVKMIEGSFTSKWSGGIVATTCRLDLNSGELFPEIIDAPDDLGNLEREYFTVSFPPADMGKEYEVCTTCHEFILKTVMNPGLGHDLNEEEECSNSDCESHEE